MFPYLIGVSGKIGSGKNYLAESITDVLESKNFVVKEASFATALKAEGTAIIQDFLPYVQEPDENIAQGMVVLSVKYDIQLEDMKTLFSFVQAELIKDPGITGYSRSEGVRRLLQYLGTEIRRKSYEDYWVDKFTLYLPKDCDFVFVTDVRFPNEAYCVLGLGGSLIRVEVSPDVIRERVIGRDGLLYSEEALNHPSETSLDNFPAFSKIVGASFDAEDLAAEIMEKASLSAK